MFKNNNTNTEKKSSEQLWFNKLYSMIIDSIKDISNYREFNKNENLDFNIKLLNNIDKNEVNIVIFFTRKRIKFVVEKWLFTIENNESGTLKFINQNKLHKKLLIMNKSIKFMLKFLPLFQLYKLKDGNFDFKLELEVEINKNDSKFYKNNSESLIIEPINDIFGKFNLQVEYITKNTVFQIEEELNKLIIENEFESRKINNDENTDESDIDKSKTDDNIDLCEREKKELENLQYNISDIYINTEDENESSFEDDIISFENEEQKDNNLINDNHNKNDEVFLFGKYDENQILMKNSDDELPLLSEIKIEKKFNIYKNFYKLKHNMDIYYINNNKLKSMIKKMN